MSKNPRFRNMESSDGEKNVATSRSDLQPAEAKDNFSLTAPDVMPGVFDKMVEKGVVIEWQCVNSKVCIG